MRLPLLSLLAGCSLSAAAQQYVPFPAGDAVWIVRAGRGDTTAAYSCYGLKNGDTALGTRTYHRLYQSADSVFTAGELIGGLREEAKRVYYYSITSHTESLLYDFNLTVGDTVKGITAQPGSKPVVTAIDSMLVNGSYRRRLAIGTQAGSGFTKMTAWVEGIGNTQLGSLLFTATARPTCDCATDVVCFGQSGQWSYHNPDYGPADCGTVLLGVPQTGVLQSAPVLVPNPVNGTGRLDLEPGHSYQTFTVYTAAGQRLLVRDVTHNTSVPVEVGAWPAGLYYYQLTDQQGRTQTARFTVR